MKHVLILFLGTELNYATLCVNQNRTYNGKWCRKWNTVSGQKDHVSKVREITGHTDHNQCVSIDGLPVCYTRLTDSLSYCHCYEESANCSDVTTTKNGHKCQKWTSTAPHEPNSWMVAALHGEERQVPNHNFCRVADPKDPEPWCYTTDPVKGCSSKIE